MRAPVPIGATFGRLTVLAFAMRHARRAHWSCRCDCGTVVIADAYDIKAGHTRSCGCLRSEVTKAIFTTHGGRRTPEYRSWMSMLQRCLNPRVRNYPDYGGRGVTVCERWRGQNGAAHFLADMGPRPSPAHSLDRTDNSKGYEPGNCRWATRVEQGSNKRNNRLLEVKGETATISEWARRTGKRRKTIDMRLLLGWPVDEAVLLPTGAPR